MPSVSPPSNEYARIEALKSYDVLGSKAEPSYDDIVKLASIICDTPIALISLIDADHQWFKATLGVDAEQTPREQSLCAHAILTPDDILIIEDTNKDPRFTNNSPLKAPPGIRFYAGCPLNTPSGHAIGTLCVMDTKPHHITPAQSEALQVLAKNVMQLLEHRKSQKALTIRNRHLELAEKVAGLGHWTLDLLNNSIHWSDEIYRIHGVTPETYQPEISSAIDFYHPDDKRLVEKLVSNAIEDHEPFEFELRLIRPDGRIRNVYSKGECQVDNSGKLVALFGIFQDITKRKESEEELSASNTFLELIMDNNPDLIFVKDEGFRIVKANSAFLSLYPKEQRGSIIGHTTLEKYSPQEAEAFLVEDRYAFKHGYSETIETIHFPDGRARTLYTTKIRFEDAAGEAFILGIARDITDLRSAEQSMASLGRIVEESLNEVYIFDQNTLNFLEVNRGARQNVGYSMDELYTMTPADIKPQYTLETFHNLLQPLLKGLQEEVVLESIHQRKDGSLYDVEVRMQQASYRSRQVFVAMITDITKRREAEEQQLKLLEKLTTSNTELERFAYVASHDMQEPLRMIINFSQVIATDYRDRLDEQGQEYLQLLVDSGSRMRDMVSDLLDYARHSHENTRSTKINTTNELRHVLEDLNALITQHSAKITWDTLPNIHGNPIQFMSLLQNLISNGIKYQAEGNVPQIHIGCETLENAWQFTISDNGIGIDPQFIGSVFEPFRRLHNWESYQGTGLGLALCKRIVQNHGGDISLSSTPGSGSTFTFTISRTRNTQEYPRIEPSRLHMQKPLCDNDDTS